MASEIQEKIEKTIEIALYSDDASVREIVKKALEI